jgi:sugar fermentation stimulation protein A
VKYGDNSRIDFLLSGAGPDTYVEVKSVTLSRQTGLADFPDSVTARGLKHLNELSKVAQDGARAVMFYLVQRTDCARVSIAGDIDPAYADGLANARAAGVQVMAMDCRISPDEISLGKTLPFSAP